MPTSISCWPLAARLSQHDKHLLQSPGSCQHFSSQAPTLKLPGLLSFAALPSASLLCISSAVLTTSSLGSLCSWLLSRSSVLGLFCRPCLVWTPDVSGFTLSLTSITKAFSSTLHRGGHVPIFHSTIHVECGPRNAQNTRQCPSHPFTGLASNVTESGFSVTIIPRTSICLSYFIPSPHSVDEPPCKQAFSFICVLFCPVSLTRSQIAQGSSSILLLCVSMTNRYILNMTLSCHCPKDLSQ